MAIRYFSFFNVRMDIVENVKPTGNFMANSYISFFHVSVDTFKGIELTGKVSNSHRQNNWELNPVVSQQLDVQI